MNVIDLGGFCSSGGFDEYQNVLRAYLSERKDFATSFPLSSFVFASKKIGFEGGLIESFPILERASLLILKAIDHGVAG